MNICSLLEQVAREHPDRIAIVYDGKSLTYRELVASVRGKAAYLLKCGISVGDRVLIFVPMSSALYVNLLAVLWVGATAAFVDPWMTCKSLLAACRKVKPQGFIGVPKAHLLRLLSPEIRAPRIKEVVLVSHSQKYKTASTTDIRSVANEHPALITFTTGSTGVPKAGIRTHRFLIRQHEMLTKYLDTRKGDVDLTILPVFVLHNLALGATSVIPKDNITVARIDTDEVSRLSQYYGVTTSTGSPAFFKRLANAGVGASLRAIHVGGAPCFATDVVALRRALPQTKITIIYGSTEAEPIAEIDARELLTLHSANSLIAGKPIDEIDLRIISMYDVPIRADDIEHITLPEGEVGEICVAAEHVMTSYLDSPEAFAANKIVSGDRIWHRTGDAGYLDASGMLHLMGRVDHRIELKGKTIFPIPAEQTLRSISGVKQGTLCHVNGKLYAVIEGELQVSLQTVQKCIPDVQEVFMIDKFPYDPRHNAKIDYTALKKRLGKPL